MAQSPDNKSTSTNIENSTQSDIERKGQAAAGQTASVERNMTAAARSATEHGSEATQQAAHQFGEAFRQNGSAGAEATQMAAAIGSETIRRGATTLAEGRRQLMEEIAERFEHFGSRMAMGLQDSAADLRTFIVPPTGGVETMRDLQEGVTGMVNGVVHTNLRATQQIFRMVDPGAIYELQRNFVRDYMDTMLNGAGFFARLARQAADQTLRPIEGRLEERQQHMRHEQNHSEGRHQHHDDHAVVSDVMSSEVRLVNPDDTVQQASRMMRDEDTGVLPVSENDRLVGVVTDRDVTLRLVAEGKDPTRTKVREVMSQDLKYVYEDEELGHVADNMAEQQVRRLPVVNRNKRLVGVVSLGDLPTRAGRSGGHAGRAMRGVSREASPNAAE